MDLSRTVHNRKFQQHAGREIIQPLTWCYTSILTLFRLLLRNPSVVRQANKKSGKHIQIRKPRIDKLIPKENDAT
jgi:hypothetical protein